MSTPESPAVAGHVKSLLRLEGLAIFVLATLAYRHAGGSWGLFAALFLVPDLSFAGYLAGPRVGAVAYNAMHSYAGPALLAALALSGLVPGALPIACIWFAHVGVDRALGYGLKYASAFGHTHLGRIGKAARAVPVEA